MKVTRRNLIGADLFTSRRLGSRYRQILKAVVSAIFGRGANLVIGAITVPITLRYLGKEGFGLWITISSAVSMLLNFDIGIANTLTNLISEAYAKGDRDMARDYFATALWVVLALISCMAGIAWLVWPYLNWDAFFRISTPSLSHEVSSALAIGGCVFLLYLPSGLATRVLSGYQELHVANYFAAGGSILGLVAILIVVHLKLALPVLVGGYAGSVVVANCACMIWIVFISKPWMKPWPIYFRGSRAAHIFGTGSKFFVIQLTSIVIWNSDNIVISHYLGAAAVTPYSVTWRLGYYIIALQTLSSPALWPAYSEAYARGDHAWIRKTYRRMRWATIALLSVGGGIVVIWGRAIIRVWAGASAIPEPKVLWLMCIWMSVWAISINQSTLLGATSRIGKQAFTAVAAAILNLGLSVLWVRSMGTSGVIIATILSFVFFVLIVQGIEVRRILRGEGSDIAASEKQQSPLVVTGLD